MIYFCIYLLSLIFVWIHINISYSKGGIFEYQQPSVIDVIATVTPIINTLIMIVDWCFIGSPRKKMTFKYEKIRSRNNRFFSLKK